MSDAEELAASSKFLVPSSRLVLPFKLNVHLEIEDPVCQTCLDLNSLICRSVGSEIEFAPPSLQKPHLTLAMGYCDSEYAYQRILEGLQQFTAQLGPVDISTGPLYLKPPKRNYVFLDIEPADNILRLKRELSIALGHNLLPLDWDVVAESPHITLAYVAEQSPEVNELIARNTPQPTSAKLGKVAVSAAGPRGSCIGSIRRSSLAGVEGR